MGAYAAALEGIGKLDGVQGVFMLADGDIVESVSGADLNLDSLKALALNGMRGGARAAELLGREAPVQGYVEYQNRSITLEALPGDRYLVVVAKPGTNLGRIKLEMKKSKKLIEESRA